MNDHTIPNWTWNGYTRLYLIKVAAIAAECSRWTEHDCIWFVINQLDIGNQPS